MKHDRSPDNEPRYFPIFVGFYSMRQFLQLRPLWWPLIVLFVAMGLISHFFGRGIVDHALFSVAGAVVAFVLLFRMIKGYWPLQGSRKVFPSDDL